MSRLQLWQKDWDPFRDFALAPRNLEKFFEDIYSPEMRKAVGKGVMTPNVDVHESKTEYSFKFDLPGIPKDQIKVDLDDNTLTVSGERREERKAEEGTEKKTHLSEVYYGSFSRSFTFPEVVDAEKSVAKYDNGVLTLTIPKKEVSNKRQLTVK